MKISYVHGQMTELKHKSLLLQKCKIMTFNENPISPLFSRIQKKSLCVEKYSTR